MIRLADKAVVATGLTALLGLCLVGEIRGDDPGHASEPAAAVDHGGEEHADHGHHSATVHGAPPAYYDFLGSGTEFLYVSPVLFGWTLLVFLALYFIMRTLAWGPILTSFDRRERALRSSLEAAEATRQQAKELLAHQDEVLGAAHEKAKEVLERARAEAGAEAEERLTAAREAADAKQQAALEEIAAAKTTALAEIRESSAELAAQFTSKLTGKTVSDAELRPFVDSEGRSGL